MKLRILLPNRLKERSISINGWETAGGVVFPSGRLHSRCTTELGTVAKYKEAFNKRNVKVVALSVDGLESHNNWIKDINETQHTTVNFPIIADEDQKVSTLYDMIHPNANDKLTVRSVFVIGADKKVKLTITYPASTGRNFDELLRVIDSLQLTAYHKVATPANWQNGEDCVISLQLQTKKYRRSFPKGMLR